MKTLILFFALGLISCDGHEAKVAKQPTHERPFSSDHPDDFITPNGQEIRYVVKDSSYYMQWEQAGTLKTLDVAFYLVQGGNTSFPSFLTENESYVVLRSGCGNPCWLGFFLPLYADGTPQVVHMFIAMDLQSELVAHVCDIDSVCILNLRTSQVQHFNPGQCESAFLGYCIDTAYFKNKTLHYEWTGETVINSDTTTHKEYRIKNVWQ